MVEPARITLDHLDRMTDSTGLIQHAIYAVPRRESGYTTDDNARAMRLCTRLWCRLPDDRMLNRIAKYLSLLEYARRPGGGFHNLLSYQRHWLNADGDGDCQGQAVRALAEVLASRLPEDYRLLAGELIDGVVSTLSELRSTRAQAYTILAWGHLRLVGATSLMRLENVARRSAHQLVDCYRRSRRPDWHWFESRLTYANGVLPHAMFVAAQCWPDGPFLGVANEAFAFLDQQTTVDRCFSPVGNNGWYAHGELKAKYDQQPIEAVTMADAAIAGFAASGDESRLATFQRARNWFHGENSLGQSMVDVASGACCDGLQENGVNRNQGAESTLAYLCTEVQSEEMQVARAMNPCDGDAIPK